ncbi:MAG: hypothetical protein G01um10142_67 [Parcubacteria group bacterium Gr01-1014_2]|nr:MAG: hypothetical protein G01um10142_67 [Parcubacteria group bacterium Gr01-1014_2]
MNEKITDQIKKAPDKPGIYIFSAKGGPAGGWKNILYIGKAGNLKNRLRQYLNKKTDSPFGGHLLNEAERLETKITGSEIEALILESKLIKEKQPKFNILLRDDKQYFYVGFSNENFPKIFITHQPAKTQKPKFKNLQNEFIGPFTDGNALKSTLRLLRKIFPYCTCKQPHHNFCLNYHIGKCLGFCCLKQQNPNLKIKNQNAKLYKKNVTAIKNILSGKKDTLVRKLKKELNRLAESKEFEKAIELRNKVEKLEKVFANAKIIQDTRHMIRDTKSVLKKLSEIFKLPAVPKRIEGYDISNIQGKNAVGAMVVFSNGRPDKKEYRKFKIMTKKTPDDTAMLKEVLIRRFRHSGMPRTPKPLAKEWPYPDLIFIDGGIAQLNIAIKTTAGRFPIISLAKGKKEVFSFTPYEAARARRTSLLRLGSTLKKPMPMKKLPPEVQNFIKWIDSEAHRFAISYYRKLHRKTALQKTIF